MLSKPSAIPPRNASGWETRGSFDACYAAVCQPWKIYPYLEEQCLSDARMHQSSSNNWTCDLCCPMSYQPTRPENMCLSISACHTHNLLEETVRAKLFKDCSRGCCTTHANFTWAVMEHCNRAAIAEGVSFYGLLMALAAILLLLLAYIMIKRCLRKRRQQKAPGTTDGANDTRPRCIVPSWLHLPHTGPPFHVKSRKVSITNQAEQGIRPIKSRKLRQRMSAAVSREE